MKKQNISSYFFGKKKVKTYKGLTVAPFPQANDLSKVIRICEMASYYKEIELDDITKEFGFTERQSYMYVNAGIYLGLMQKLEVKKYTTTGTGSMIGTPSRGDNNVKLTERILSRKPFHSSVMHYLFMGILSSPEELAIMIQKDDPELGVETACRRASTVLSWSKWIVENNTVDRNDNNYDDEDDDEDNDSLTCLSDTMVS